MWRNQLFSVIVCARILGVAQASFEELGKCTIESPGHRYCLSENAVCKESAEDSKGYICVCQEGQIKMDNFCIDEQEQTTRSPFAESTSSTLSPSSGSSTPSVVSSSSVLATTSVPVSGMRDWPLAASITVACLVCIIVVLAAFLVCQSYRYFKIKSSQQLEGNQVVYKKAKEDLHSSSVLGSHFRKLYHILRRTQ